MLSLLLLCLTCVLKGQVRGMLAAANPQEVWTVEKGKLQLVFCWGAKGEPGNWAECNKRTAHYFGCWDY